MTRLLFLLCILLISCKQKSTKTLAASPDRYQIEGNIKGLRDSTWIYLNKLSTIDSTLLINGMFFFQGKIKEKAKKVIIGTKNNELYKFFWLENKNIKFNADSINFKNASVKGSLTNDEDDKLDELNSKQQDSIFVLARITPKSLKEQKRLLTKVDSLQKLIDETNIQFIKKNTNSIISISLLSTYGSSWGKKLSQNLYDKLSKNVQNSNEGKEFLKYLRLSQDVSIGNKYADFTQFDTLGRKRKLSDFIGKPLLIEFWASWCIPCRRNNPELLKVYKKFHKRGFEILGVSTDNKKQNWLQAIKTDKLIWQNVSELNGETNTAAQVYNVDQIPTNFLISKDGKIIARNIDNTELTKILTTLLL